MILLFILPKESPFSNATPPKTTFFAMFGATFPSKVREGGHLKSQSNLLAYKKHLIRLDFNFLHTLKLFGIFIIARLFSKFAF